MSDLATKEMMDLYVEEAPNPMFLTGFFEAPARNFFTTEKVEIDILRDSEDVAIVVHDLSAGTRKNEATKFDSKEFTPPVFNEEGHLSSFSLIKRAPGHNAYEDIEYGARTVEDAFRLFDKCQRKILRAIELMASQIVTTGTVTCVDNAGVALYSLDYGMRSDHKIAVSWAANGSSGNPLGDLTTAAKRIRSNGKVQPVRTLWGATALDAALANANFKERIKLDGINLGKLAPEVRGEGATFYGYIQVGYYKFEIWTYDGMYKDPVSGQMKYYIPENVVVMLPSKPRFNAKYGHIPLFKSQASGIPGLPNFPERIMSSEKNIDLTVNSWVTPNGTQLMMSAGTRPILIPTAIDTFACLTVTVT